jgi:hypothetical protein
MGDPISVSRNCAEAGSREDVRKIRKRLKKSRKQELTRFLLNILSHPSPGVTLFGAMRKLRIMKWRALDSQTPIWHYLGIETPASNFKLRANVPEGRKRFPISQQI